MCLPCLSYQLIVALKHYIIESNVIILPVKPANYRLIHPLEVVNANYLRPGKSVFQKVAVCLSPFLLIFHPP